MGDVVGGAVHVGEVAACDELAAVRGQRDDVAVRSPFGIIPGAAVPVGNVTDGDADRGKEASAGPELAVVHAERVHLIVHAAAQRRPRAAVPGRDIVAGNSGRRSELPPCDQLAVVDCLGPDPVIHSTPQGSPGLRMGGRDCGDDQQSQSRNHLVCPIPRPMQPGPIPAGRQSRVETEADSKSLLPLWACSSDLHDLPVLPVAHLDSASRSRYDLRLPAFRDLAILPVSNADDRRLAGRTP